MKVAAGSTLVLLSVVTAIPAIAMTRDDARMNLGGAAAIADPDAHLDRLAAAASGNDLGHSKPQKSVRNLLRDDPYLRAAFGWIDNK
ncbi:hypothetical protein [uncultured Sphingomonas sp.]|uniref:hypothetical protein n=1 Tax=uncultured Sphingomonas sp. TaxID=158754 RepID=UPI00262CD9DC|nr:hypothetical protein [uncultured Sphingomonas sp.]